MYLCASSHVKLIGDEPWRSPCDKGLNPSSLHIVSWPIAYGVPTTCSLVPLPLVKLCRVVTCDLVSLSPLGQGVDILRATPSPLVRFGITMSFIVIVTSNF